MLHSGELSQSFGAIAQLNIECQSIINKLINFKKETGVVDGAFIRMALDTIDEIWRLLKLDLKNFNINLMIHGIKSFKELDEPTIFRNEKFLIERPGNLIQKLNIYIPNEIHYILSELIFEKKRFLNEPAGNFSIDAWRKKYDKYIYFFHLFLSELFDQIFYESSCPPEAWRAVVKSWKSN